MNNNRHKTAPLLSLIATLLLISPVSNADNDSQAGPPPEAFTACEGKATGDTAQFENRHGKMLIGKCEELDGKNAGNLVLRPDKYSHKNKKNNKQRTPPPEAYTACEDKGARELSQFTNRRGETLTGTCEDENGKLVLRPDRRKE